MNHKEELAENVLGLFKSSEYSDLTIIASGNKTFKVHKALVCSRSEFFRKACKDEVWEEGQNGVIRLQDDQDIPVQINDPVVVEYMLQYLYGLDYMEEPGEYDDFTTLNKKKKLSKVQSKRRERLEFRSFDSFGAFEDEPMVDESNSENSTGGVSSGGNAAVHAQMCAIADFYGVPDLQKVAHRKFRAAFSKIQDHRAIVPIFKLVCDPSSRSDAVLRDIMVDKIAINDDLLDNQEIEEVLRIDGELSLAIAKKMR